MLAVLYDIHGNLPALEAVLADMEDAGADRFLLGGDYGTPSPWPHETLARLRELPKATWIRGNGERWLREQPEISMVIQAYEEFEGVLADEEVDWLYGLPVEAELDGILYVHGSPVSDVESFAPQPRTERSACWAASATGRSCSATATSSSAARVRTAPTS